MIISHEHRYLFVEIPHTGSHSIASELIEHYQGERILRKHANLTQFLAQASPSEKKYFIFGTVRNPLDATVTDYSKLESNHREQYTNATMLRVNGGHVTEEHVAQFRYVQEHTGDFPGFLRTYRNKIYHNWFLIGSRRFDFVLRFENLRTDYEQLIEKLGLDLVQSLPHVNPTAKKVRRFEEFYSPDIQELAAHCYGPFMRKWRYEFPSTWENVRVPLASVARFELIEFAVESVARYAKMDPDDPGVNRIKKLVERFC